MDNGRTKEVISQFDIISKLPDYWNHNQHYHKYLLKQIKSKKNIGLDVGCGTGELTKKLSEYCDKAIGIDVSGSMINEAIKRNKVSNVFFKNQDVESFLEETTEKYDIIVSVATFHHLNMEYVLKLLKKKLNSGGIILILDLYKASNIFDLLLSIIAAFCNPIMYLLKRGTLFNTKAERKAWKDHFKYDEYYRMKEIKNISKAVLGKLRIKQHLFWRYSLIYKS